MKKILLFCAFLISLTLNAQTPSSIIIKLKNDFKKVSLKGVDSISKQFNSTSVRKLYTGKKSNVQLFEISFSKNEDIDAVIKKYIETGLIEYAEPHHPVYPGGRKVNTTPNDSQFYKQWSLNNNGSFNLSPSVAGADINIEAAWDIEQGDENVIVAVIDSGIYVHLGDFVDGIDQPGEEGILFEEATYGESIWITNAGRVLCNGKMIKNITNNNLLKSNYYVQAFNTLYDTNINFN